MKDGTILKIRIADIDKDSTVKAGYTGTSVVTKDGIDIPIVDEWIERYGDADGYISLKVNINEKQINVAPIEPV
ncbi:MAG: hypothetical protein KQI78_12275 [Deltaproteobacteria bacterium]|nr:hypothetical protein [Deltaproteobacteria bacterium]